MSSTTTTEEVTVTPVVQEKPKTKTAISMENIINKIDDLELSLLAHRKAVDSIVTEVKGLQKQAKKHAKRLVSKGKSKTQTPGVDQKPHGFAVPTVVSDELCAFLGVEAKTLVARTTVTTALRNYIKENNLQNPENKREIIPDVKLSALFGEEAANVKLNMFNMQKYINRHFPSKKIPVSV